MPTENNDQNPKSPWKIKLLAICLIVFFGLGSVLTILALLVPSRLPISTPNVLFATATNIGFVVGGVGLLRLKPWSLWLTVGLCAISILHLFFQLFTTLTPQTATKLNETISYITAGFYLSIAFFLTSDSSRKMFRLKSGSPQQ